LWLPAGCGWGDHVHLPGGYTLCFEVGPDGDAWPLIADDRVEGPTPRPDPGDLAPHERLGRLPTAWRERLELRCGAPTRKGRPCRIEVDRPGDRCAYHREAGP
jgi:hypothetical protein